MVCSVGRNELFSADDHCVGNFFIKNLGFNVTALEDFSQDQ